MISIKCLIFWTIVQWNRTAWKYVWFFQVDRLKSIFLAETFPSINGNPTIKPGIKNKRLEFICEFQSSDTDPDSIFEVTWYQGSRAEKIKLTHTLRGTQRKASLQNIHEAPRDEDKIYFKLGTTVSVFVYISSHFNFKNILF